MRLGGQLITSYCGINNFEHTTAINRNDGDATRVYLQLVDYNKKVCSDIKGSCYIRYIPDAGASLSITIDDIDDDDIIQRAAVQVVGDPSLFYFDIYEGESIGSENIHLSLSEPGKGTKTGVINGAIKTHRAGENDGQSFC